MDRVQRTSSLFENGLNCSQAILTAFGEAYGVGLEDAARIGRPWGGGIAHMGLTCGAVTAAILILGLAQGNGEDEKGIRNRVFKSGKEFVRRFEERYKTTFCRDLLGVDIATESGLKRIREENLVRKICPPYVRGAAEILVEMQGSCPHCQFP